LDGRFPLRFAPLPGHGEYIMTRFLIIFALMLFIVWWLRRVFWRVTRKTRSARHHDAIETSYTVVEDETDKDKVP
jgi:hypothetical protein